MVVVAISPPTLSRAVPPPSSRALSHPCSRLARRITLAFSRTILLPPSLFLSLSLTLSLTHICVSQSSVLNAPLLTPPHLFFRHQAVAFVFRVYSFCSSWGEEKVCKAV